MRPVVYVTRFVPGYRRPVLEALNTALGGCLVVCAGQPPSASFASLSTDAPAGYRQVRLRNYWIAGDRMHAQGIGRILRLEPGVVLAEESPRTLTLPLLLSRARRRNSRTLLWGHFSSNNRPFGSAHPMDRYRIALARRADGCVCYTESIAASLAQFVPSERLFAARNTLDIRPLLELHRRLTAEGRPAIRKRLGLKAEGPVLAYLGRLIPEKKLDTLLDIYGELRRHQPASLVIIGDGPERAAIEPHISGRRGSDVILTGSLTNPRDSAPWLMAADVLVCPGYLGLAINHAFALGLPVVTQSSPDPDIRYHSPEIAYLKPGENGMTAPFGDVPALARAVQTVLADQPRFAANALAYARENLQLETMLEGLLNAIAFAES
ncbi:MAG: glycosyltransferase family 4 protein [Bacteroidota bacterium]|nr:glycosyltransferase family 4 protein [Bacteroidota bacterium]